MLEVWGDPVVLSVSTDVTAVAKVSDRLLSGSVIRVSRLTRVSRYTIGISINSHSRLVTLIKDCAKQMCWLSGLVEWRLRFFGWAALGPEELK